MLRVFNLQMEGCEEFEKGISTAIGQVLIRCNNILYIKGADEGGEEGEMNE